MKMTLTFDIDMDLMSERLGIADLKPEMVPEIVHKELGFIRGIGITVDTVVLDYIPEVEPENLLEVVPEITPEMVPEVEPEVVPRKDIDFQTALDLLIAKHG